RLFLLSRILSVRALLFSRHPATPDLSTLSLHDALPISNGSSMRSISVGGGSSDGLSTSSIPPFFRYTWYSTVGAVVIRSSRNSRSEEHTSELQSLAYLVCRLLLEKKKTRGAAAAWGGPSTAKLIWDWKRNAQLRVSCSCPVIGAVLIALCPPACPRTGSRSPPSPH